MKKERKLIVKRIIEISSSFTGTIPTGQYENEKPFYSIKEVVELDEVIFGKDATPMFDDCYLKERQRQLHDICYQQFKRQAEVSYSEKIAKQFQNIRFYPGADGVMYPSVTSFLNWDADFHVSPDELAQYAARGTIYHKLAEIFLTTGEWKAPKDVPEIYEEVVLVKGGTLGLSLEDVDFPGFYAAYPFKVIELEKSGLNHEHKFGGRMDIKCIIEAANPGKWDKVEGVVYDTPTILDIKTGATLDKTKGLKQQTAYAMFEGHEDVSQVGLIHLNKETKQGFSKPCLENTVKYKEALLKDRASFKKRFGV